MQLEAYKKKNEGAVIDKLHKELLQARDQLDLLQ